VGALEEAANEGGSALAEESATTDSITLATVTRNRFLRFLGLYGSAPNSRVGYNAISTDRRSSRGFGGNPPHLRFVFLRI
jgi:hypothetical protein